MIIKLNKTEYEKDIHLFFHSIFITPQWIESVNSRSSPSIYLDIFDDNNKIGKISGLIENSKFGKQLYFYASPALIEITELNYIKCLDYLISYAKNNKVSRIIIGSYDNKHSLKYYGKNYYNTQRAEYIVPLYKGKNNIKQNKQFKRNIKKAQKIPVSNKCSNNKDHIKILLSLLQDTLQTRIKKYNNNYSPFYLKKFSEDTLRKLLANGIAKIHYTVHNNNHDCIEFNLESNGKVYMLLKGTNEFGYKNGLPSFLSDELIQRYINKGFKYYNQGGRPNGPDGNGLAIFKKSLGAEEIISYGVTTNFLIWPYKILNPIIIIGRIMPQNNILIMILKKILYR